MNEALVMWWTRGIGGGSSSKSEQLPVSQDGTTEFELI